MTTALDVAINTTPYLNRFKEAGITTVIRYLSPGAGQKVVKVPEAQAIGRAGMSLGLVYQVYNNADKYFDHAQGAHAGVWTKNYLMNVLKAPKGTCVFFAVDYDANRTAINGRIKEYFKAIRSVLVPTYRVGVYGSGLACRLLKEAGLVDKVWITQSMGYQESRKAVAEGRYDMLQQLPKRIGGVLVDPDYIKNEIGSFVPFQKPNVVKPVIPAVIAGGVAAAATPTHLWPWVVLGTVTAAAIGAGVYYYYHYTRKV